MNSSKFGKITSIVIIIAIVFIVIVIGGLGYEIIKETASNKSDASAATEDSEIEAKVAVANKVEDVGEIGNLTVENYTSSGTSSSEKEMLNGYEVIGKLTIPTIKLNEKVLAELTSGSLNTAVALAYTQNGLNQPGNTVIMGHNYKNGTLFSNNDKLKVGDTIYLEDKSGEKVKYKITEKFETSASDSSFFTAGNAGIRTLTLSTCTDDASTTDMRLVVIAEEVEE